MSDSRAHDTDLPWLQEVDDEDAPSGISARRMLAGLVIVLVAAAAIAGTFFWLGRSDSGAPGAPELIRAAEGPYKVKPQDPGGLDVAGDSQTAFETSAGQDVDSRLAGQPEAEPEVEPEVEPKRIPPGETREPLPAETPQAPEPELRPSGAQGSVVQLGAYRNTAQAERAWTALSTRFPAVAGLTKIVVPYSAGGSSGYRLRASATSPDQARQVCQSLEAAGESCFIAR
ncbi:MAG: SPOR domain-containing protein [Pseudomonadota bacterium]|nr:SPOR domain-containing protein [Pseudomonadota bacterium]